MVTTLCLLVAVCSFLTSCVKATVPDGYYNFHSLKINGETVTEGETYDFYLETCYVVGATRIMELGYGDLDQKFQLEGDKIMVNTVNQTWQFSELYYRDDKIVRILDDNIEIIFARQS